MVGSLVAGVAKGTAPGLAPIEFAPGSAAIDETGRNLLDGVAALLVERPKLSLRVCGRSTDADLQTYSKAGAAPAPPTKETKGGTGGAEVKPAVDPAQAKQALNELAVERQRGVRRYLIQEKGADVNRIPECRATFDADDQGSPRVEISL